MSSKGQVVIPADMRGDFREGDSLVVIKNGDQIILKKATSFDKNLQEDLKFAKKTEEVYRRHERGDFIEMDSEEFLKEIKKW